MGEVATLDASWANPVKDPALRPGWRTAGRPGWPAGYLAALLFVAIDRAATTGRALTFSARFYAQPRADDVELEVQRRFVGPSTECLAGALIDRGRRCVEAEAWFAVPQSGPPVPSRAAPPVRGPEGLADLGELLVGRRSPHLEVRPVDWTDEAPPVPRSPMRCWARLRGDQPFGHALASVVALVDVLAWAAVFDTQPGPVPSRCVTIDLRMTFHDASHAGPWLLGSFEARPAGDGLVASVGDVWDEQGSLLASVTAGLLWRSRST